jgi:predicted DNA-binding transcriptional regulator YafY
VSRIDDVANLDDGFDRPTDFDLPRYWGDAVAEFEANAPGVEVVVVATPNAFDRLQRMSRYGGRALRGHRTLDDGRAEVRFAFESFDEAYLDLLSLGAEVEVVEPGDLRIRIAAMAGELHALYA